MTAPATFAALHCGPRPLLLANAWDVASAVLLEAAGAPAVGTTSLGVTASMGYRDGIRAGRDATVTLAALLTSRLTIPVTVDLEDGFSDNPAEVAALAAELAAVGVAGINLEDGRPDRSLRAVADHSAVIEAGRQLRQRFSSTPEPTPTGRRSAIPPTAWPKRDDA